MMLECSTLNGRKVSDWLRLCHMTRGRSSILSLQLLEQYSLWVWLFCQLALLSHEIRGKPTHAVHKKGGHLAVAWHLHWQVNGLVYILCLVIKSTCEVNHFNGKMLISIARFQKHPDVHKIFCSILTHNFDISISHRELTLYTTQINIFRLLDFKHINNCFKSFSINYNVANKLFTFLFPIQKLTMQSPQENSA